MDEDDTKIQMKNMYCCYSRYIKHVDVANQATTQNKKGGGSGNYGAKKQPNWTNGIHAWVGKVAKENNEVFQQLNIRNWKLALYESMNFSLGNF